MWVEPAKLFCLPMLFQKPLLQRSFVSVKIDCHVRGLQNFFQHLWLSEVWFRVAATTMTAGALALPSHCPSFLLQRTGPLGQRSMCLTLLRCTNDVSQPSSCPALEHSGRVIRWVKFRAIGNPLGLTFILQSVCISYLYFFHCFSSMSSMLSLSGYNFGNGFYNDHHFHYGYFVYSAAVPWSNLWWYVFMHCPPGHKHSMVNASMKRGRSPRAEFIFPISWTKTLFGFILMIFCRCDDLTVS